MRRFRDLRDDLGRAWETLAEGWEQLRERAAGALTRFNPVAGGGEVQTLEDQVARGGARWGLLAAEVQETAEEVIVRLEVPGMELEDLDVFVAGDLVMVRGEKRVQRQLREGRYHVMECAYGSFERAVPLPAPVDESGARASYRRGVLEVTLPRRDRLGSRRIRVETL